MPGDGHTPGAGARCGCGRAVEDGHRYCPACGSLVGHLVGDGVDPDAGTLLLSPVSGAESEHTVVDEAVSTGRSPAARLAAIGSVLVLGVLAWALFRQPSGEIAPDPSADDEAAIDESTTTTRPRTTRRSRTTTTTVPTTTVLGRADGSGGPLLGEETGLILAFGSMDRNGVQLLDLDSGELQVLDRPRGQPLGRLGSSLVLFGDDGTPRLLDLDDPGAAPIRLDGSLFWSQAVNIDDDRLWVFGDGPDGMSLVAYDESGQEVDREELSSDDMSGLFAYGSLAARPPDLISHTGSGLYRQEGEGYRLVAPGRTVAVGQRLALMETCDEVLRCSLGWFDTETGAAIDHPEPARLDGDGVMTIVGGDRWLHRVEWGQNTASLVDITNGETIRELRIEWSYGPFGPSAVVSDDGRWLLDRIANGDHVVVDLETGEEWPLEGLRVGSSVGAAFIAGPG